MHNDTFTPSTSFGRSNPLGYAVCYIHQRLTWEGVGIVSVAPQDGKLVVPTEPYLTNQQSHAFAKSHDPILNCGEERQMAGLK